MADAWYYAESGNTVGPLSIDALRQVLVRSKDWRSRLVWNAGFGEWRNAGSVPGLEVPEPPPHPPVTATPEKNPWWGRILSLVVGLIMLAVVKTGVHELFKSAPKPIDVESVLDDAARKAQVPQKLDEATTLVGVKHTATKELTYFYQLDTKNYEFQPGFIVPLRQYVAPQACSKMKEVLGLGVVLAYRYRDADGKQIGYFSLNQSDCKQ